MLMRSICGVAVLLLPGLALATEDAREARMAEVRSKLYSMSGRPYIFSDREPLFVELAELGDEAAAHGLAEYYLYDHIERGGKPQTRKFLRTFKRIAEQGNRAAQFWLADFYRLEAESAIREGRSAVDALQAAYQWCLLAHISADSRAEMLLKLRQSLTADQVAEAYQQAMRVMPKNVELYGTGVQDILGNMLRAGVLVPKDATRDP